MKYTDLRDFIDQLETRGLLKRIDYPVSPYLEMTTVSDRVLQQGGPALLFTNPLNSSMPVLANLFGTPERVALGMGAESVTALREIGQLLATLKEPEPPKGIKDVFDKLRLLRPAFQLAPNYVSKAECQTHVFEGDEVN